MNEQTVTLELTLSFVLKLRVLHSLSDADSAPRLRGSLLRVGAAQGQHFDTLERLLEILSERVAQSAAVPCAAEGGAAGPDGE